MISEVQAAHDNGEFVYLLFQQTKTHDRHRFKTKLDNISFTVNGTQLVPEMDGKIAYLKNNQNGNPHAINILDPNDRNTNTIWTHPNGEFKDNSNIAWSPDATRLAFVLGLQMILPMEVMVADALSIAAILDFRPEAYFDKRARFGMSSFSLAATFPEAIERLEADLEIKHDSLKSREILKHVCSRSGVLILMALRGVTHLVQ